MLYGDFFMSRSIQKYIRENFGTIIKILGVYLVGIIIGIILFCFTDVKKEYTTIVTGILDNAKLENFEGINIISNGIRNNTLYILLLYLSSITFVAPLIICLMIILKAIVTGIYICTLFSIFGFFKGIAVVFVSVLLPISFSLCGYICICINVFSMFKSLFSSQGIKATNVLKHMYFLIIAISLISFSIVIEQLMTRVTLGIYIDLI